MRERAAKLRGASAPSLARSRKAHFAYPNRTACSQASKRSVHLTETMEGQIKSYSAKSSMNRFPKKDSLVVISVISLVLFALMFVRIEVAHRRVEVAEAKL